MFDEIYDFFRRFPNEKWIWEEFNMSGGKNWISICGRERKKSVGEQEESCMFAKRFKHLPVSGVLAFMSEIIGHFLVLSLQSFLLPFRSFQLLEEYMASFFSTLASAELVLTAFLNTRQ